MSNESDQKAPPSFSSFPAAPIFDSFPGIVGTSKSRSREHSSKPDKKRKDDRERTSSRDEASWDGKHRSEKRHRSDRAREKRNKEDPVDKRDEKRRRSRRSHSRERSPGDGRRLVARPDKGKAREEPPSSIAFYNVPDLASGETTRLLRSSETVTVAHSDVPDYKIFMADRTGDQDIRKYGKLYKGSIPKYRRSGYGQIVGLNGEFRISKESAYSGQGLEVAAGRGSSGTPRLGDRTAHLRITDRRSKRLRLGASTSKVQEDVRQNEDYVSLPRFLVGRDTVQDAELEDGQDYRSAAGLLKNGDKESDDEGDGSELEESGGESYEEQIRRKNIEFDRHLKTEPTDVKVWLDLVALQDDIHSSFDDSIGSRQKKALSNTDRRSLSEIKLSILDRALQQPANAKSVDLRLARMRYGSDIWTTAQLMTQWQALLRDLPGEMKVWISYVTFRQTRTVEFSISEIVGVYEECLAKLRTARVQAPAGSRVRQIMEENAIYMFTRLCLLLNQAGYPERAKAAFQAVMELNFFGPQDLTVTPSAPPNAQQAEFETALNRLDLFWDSEVPRIGEDDAKGWQSSGDTEPPSTSASSVPNGQEPDLDDPFCKWASSESSSNPRQARPSRSSDLDGDPFSTIFFADIRQLLFIVDDQDCRSQLIYSFLVFLGLPLNQPDTSTVSPLSSDTFLHADDFHSAARQKAFWPEQSTDAFLGSLVPFETIGGEPMEHVRRAGIKDPFQPPFRCFPVSPDLLFSSSPKWFSLLDQQEHLLQMDLPFIRASLSLLRSVTKDMFITLAYFSIEASLNPKSAVKVAKQTLKVDSRNLLLWDAYARIERARDNLKAARLVYVNALQLSQDFAEKEKRDVPLLWRAWAEMEWEAGNGSMALTILVASSSGPLKMGTLDKIAATDPPPSSALVLKARQYYLKQLTSANGADATQSQFRHRISLTFCLALIALLSGDIDDAEAVLAKQTAHLRSEASRSAEEEEALIIHAKILFRQTQGKSAFRPGRLRDLLEDALARYPNNSIFLSLYLFNEMRTRLENRTRTMLENTILKNEEVTSEGWLFAIYAELHLNARQYNPQSVRTLFERAVSNLRTRSSAGIWSLYIDFELKQNQSKRAKGVLRRALVECPWSKALYMMPFSSRFRSAYRSAELNEIHRLMLEKGIRLYHNLDEYTAGYRSEESEDDPDEAAATEDALYAQRMAAERLRLMPL